VNHHQEFRIEIAAKILAGFAANPAIFAPNATCGWLLVNCTDDDIAGYAVRLADSLISANKAVPKPDPTPAKPLTITRCTCGASDRTSHEVDCAAMEPGGFVRSGSEAKVNL
jgi:hypothetical protein